MPDASHYVNSLYSLLYFVLTISCVKSFLLPTQCGEKEKLKEITISTNARCFLVHTQEFEPRLSDAK